MSSRGSITNSLVNQRHRPASDAPAGPTRSRTVFVRETLEPHVAERWSPFRLKRLWDLLPRSGMYDVVHMDRSCGS
jgi:hypothetical protein